jgi:hypothetical protein
VIDPGNTSAVAPEPGVGGDLPGAARATAAIGPADSVRRRGACIRRRRALPGHVEPSPGLGLSLQFGRRSPLSTQKPTPAGHFKEHIESPPPLEIARGAAVDGRGWS